MVLKITEELSDRVNRIVRHSCCNCINDNCLLLDDGEEHSCVQLISKYGIYCNYLLKSAALPTLYRQRSSIQGGKRTIHLFQPV